MSQKLDGCGRWYNIYAMPPNVPAWRVVKFPTNQVFIYKDLEHATNARIIARAWANAAREHTGPNGFGWAAFACCLNYITPKRPGKKRIRMGLSTAISNRLYNNIILGTLPKDQRVRQRLIELSGYPWD